MSGSEVMVDARTAIGVGTGGEDWTVSNVNSGIAAGSVFRSSPTVLIRSRERSETVCVKPLRDSAACSRSGDKNGAGVGPAVGIGVGAGATGDS